MSSFEQTLAQGVYSLLLTPFKSNYEIDYAAYDRYVDWQLSHGPQGLFASCGSSELLTLSATERLELTRRAVARAAATGTPVVATANAGANPGEHKDELLRMAETGVAGVVLIPPNGYGNDPELLLAHFAELAAISPVPVLLYEFPGVRPHLVPPSVYGELARRKLVCGLKDTTCTAEGIAAKLDAAPNSLVLQANTPYLLDSIRQGVRGIMAITSTAKANLNIKLWAAALDPQDDGEARLLHRELVALDGLFSSGFTSCAKHLVDLQGIPFSTLTRTGAAVSPSTAQALAVWHAGLRADLR